MTEHKIGWLNMLGYKPETWNPIVGCSKVSPGCDNCYAEKMAKRIVGMLEKNKGETYQSYLWVKDWNGRTTLNTDQIDKPLQWEAPRIIFVCSMGDLFHENTDFRIIDQVFDVIQRCPQHIFIVLTKRAERMSRYYQVFHKNVWLGVTAENQEQANKRIPLLLQIPAAKRFVSVEPILGPVELYNNGYIQENQIREKGDGGKNGLKWTDNGGLDWVICGGETGHKARPMHPDWVRSVRDQCKAAGTPFFFKQWGKYYTHWANMTTWKDEFKMYESYMQFTQKLWVKKGDVLVDLDGKHPKTGGDMQTAKYPVAIMNPISVKCDTLDGQQHHNWPQLETLNLKPETL